MPRDLTAYAFDVICLRAAEIIDLDGHTKGELCDADGRVCLYGAIFKAAGWKEFPDQLPMSIAEQDAVARHLGFSDRSDAVHWNNADERTAAEVSARLRSAPHAT